MTVAGSIPQARSAACKVQPARRPSDQLTPMARARGERRSPTKTRWGDSGWLGEAQQRTGSAVEQPGNQGEQRQAPGWPTLAWRPNRLSERIGAVRPTERHRTSSRRVAVAFEAAPSGHREVISAKHRWGAS